MKLSRITNLLKKIENNGRPSNLHHYVSIFIALFALYLSYKGLTIQHRTIELQKITIELQETYRLEELKGKAPTLALEITSTYPVLEWLYSSSLSLDFMIRNVGFRGADSVESTIMLIDSASGNRLLNAVNVSFNSLEMGQTDVQPIGPFASLNLNGTVYVSVMVFYRDKLNSEGQSIFKLVKWKFIQAKPSEGGQLRNWVEPVGGSERTGLTPKFKEMMGFPEIVDAIPIH